MRGTYVPEFESVARRFDQQHRDGGGACCVYHRGRPVVDVWNGTADADTGAPWEESTTVVAFSVSKGVTATALHICVDRGLLDYDDLVATHWPGFARAGKEDITVRQVLCHEAGLYDIVSMISSPEQLLDWEAMVDALEAASPAFAPGTANAYHAVTFGYLVGELVRRTSGRGISEFVAEEIAGPLGLDGAYIGTPRDQVDRVATLDTSEGFVEALAQMGEGSTGGGIFALAEAFGLEVHPDVTRAAFGAAALRSLPENPEALQRPIPAFNGTFTARSLARLYAALGAGGTLDGVTLMSADTIARATEVQNTRPDVAIMFPMHWRLGYHGVITTAGAPPGAFGHTGIGGSGAWVDPDRELAVAMVTNRLAANLVADDRLMSIGGDAIRCVDALAGV